MEGGDKLVLKKSLNLFGAVAVIIGSIIGSGIFISPQGVLIYSGSVGLTLVVWFLCGLISIGGGLCYAELGTLIRESGGEWIYIYRGIGAAPAFVAGWMNLILNSSSIALISLASGDYLLTPFYDACGPPLVVRKLLGIALAWLALYINTSGKMASRALSFLLILKISALLVIICGGLYWMGTQGTDNLQTGFSGTTEQPWKVALAFYSGLWAYEGWNNLNYVTEEVKNPKRVLPLAIMISCGIMIVLYLLVNLSYLSVLTIPEIIASKAVAVDWGHRLAGRWSIGFAFVVSLSTFGSALAAAFGSSRLLMALSRAGHTVELLSMVDVQGQAPVMSLLMRGILSTLMALLGNIGDLIDFFSFCAWLFYGLCFTSLIVLRWRDSHAERPFRVPIVLPFIMILVSLYLMLVPIISDPKLPFLYSAVFAASGLIFYFPFVLCKVKLGCFDRVTIFFQLLFQITKPEKALQ